MTAIATSDVLSITVTDLPTVMDELVDSISNDDDYNNSDSVHIWYYIGWNN